MGEANHLREKLTLFESSNEFAWIRWIAPDQIEVIDCSGGFPLINKSATYHIHDLVIAADQERLPLYWKTINDSISSIHFSLNNQGNGQQVSCLSQKIESETWSLWSLVDQDNSMAVLQTAAHDMRSPINSIIGITNLGKQMIEKGEMNDVQMSKFLSMIEHSSYQALDLSSDLLELANVESAQFQLDSKPVVLSEFIENYINTHRLLTLKKKIELVFKSSSRATTNINESKITRVFDNIISNSVKFSPPESMITITLEEVNGLQVSIADQGVGMSEEMVSNIFEKFGKSRRKGLEGETSHGLGMSIVKQIMELHQGDVRIESEEGKGTNAILTFKKTDI